MSPNQPVSADVVTPSSLTASDIMRWRDLMVKSDSLAVAFLSPTFAIAAQDAFSNVYICKMSLNRRTVAYFPFQFRSPTHRILGIAERVGGELSDYFGMVSEQGFTIESRTLLQRCGLTALAFTHLDDSQNQFGLSGEQPEVGYRIDFPNGGAAFWKARATSNKKFTSDTERRERRLVREYGPMRFTLREPNWGSALDHLIVAKRAQYARTNVEDPLCKPNTQKFLFALAGSSDPLCQALLSTLYAGNTWVASHFGLVCGATLHYWFPVYNPRLKAFSPGRLLLKAIMDSGGEIGLTRIDRGAGDSIAKRDLATSQHHFQRGVWKRQNIISAGYQLGLSVLWRSRRFRRVPDRNATEN